MLAQQFGRRLAVAVRASRHVVLVTSVVACGWACSNNLDPYSEVKDLRVLAIKAEPPEILDSPLPDEVVFEALVVDPRGVPFTTEWEFCPVESGRACADKDELLQAALANASEQGGSIGADFENLTPAGCESVAAAYAQEFADLGDLFESVFDLAHWDNRYPSGLEGESLTVGIAQAPALPSALATDTSFLRDYLEDLEACDPTAVPPGIDPSLLPDDITDLQVFAFLSDTINSLIGVWPSAVLTVNGDDDSILAQKRVTVGFRDPRSPIEMLSLLGAQGDIGLPFCRPGQDASEGCLEIAPRQPNQNPTFEGVAISDDISADTTFADIAVDESTMVPTFEIAARDSVRILPVLGSQAYESFESVEFSFDTGAIFIREKHEDPAVSWFTTGGSFQDELTNSLQTKSLDTVFNAPDRVPEGDQNPVKLWLVARDGRGGAEWVELNARILPPRSPF